MRSILVGALLLGGCGRAATEAQLRDLRARLDAGERTRIEQGRKLEELDNRVFLLTDQVESQKVALSQRGGEPRLPVVTLRPPVQAPPAPPPAPALRRDSILIGPPAVDPLPEPEPPTTISNSKRPTITLTGATPLWLGPDRDARTDAASRAASAGPPSVRAAPSAAVGRRGPRTVSPPAADGLGVTHGKPPLVDQVVAGSGAAVTAKTPAAAVAAPVEEDPTAIYRAAYGLLKAGQPMLAAEDLRGFVRRFPHHDLADNAQYWLGESYYTRGDYKDAEPEFRAVIRRWPSGNKAPDALLKLGFCMLLQGERTEGRATLEQLVEHYPRTEAAQLASKRLQELGPEGKR